MIAGISTACLYPDKTEDVVTLLCDHNVQAIELFINSFSEMEPAYLKNIRSLADEGAMRILSIHPFTCGLEPMLFFSKYSRRFEDGRELYKRFYDAANLCGAELLVFHGNLLQFKMEPAEYADRLGILLEDASRQGVRLCHENVSRCTGREPIFFREMRRLLPQAEFVLDIKQAVRAGEDVWDFLDAMGDKIAHIHMSDHGQDEDCLSIGKGEFNIERFLMKLREKEFCGGVIVELYRENFADIVELLEGYQQLSRYISTVS